MIQQSSGERGRLSVKNEARKKKRRKAERRSKMTEEEKKLLQAKHRLEEARMRDRAKERKDRTRRLIQEGAILEKVFPWASGIQNLSELEEKLYEVSQRTPDC